jgi:hypothetical protein
MKEIFVGLIGIIIGIVFSEILRRLNRSEIFASQIFSERLRVYEGLYDIVHHFPETISAVSDPEKLSFEEARRMVSEAIGVCGRYCDKNSFYLDDESAIQSMTPLMGLEDIRNIQDFEEREKQAQEIRDEVLKTQKMKRDKSGMTKIDKFFRKTHKSDIKSDALEYWRKIRTEYHTR